MRHRFVPLGVALVTAICLGGLTARLHGEAAGWRPLFDGKTTAGWHPYGKPNAGPPAKAHGWDVVDGTLVALGKGSESTDDIVTDEMFTDFELQLEWKVAPQANSGVFYGVVEDTTGKSPIYATGPEYQLIDEDGWAGPLEAWQKSGADYAMHPPRVKAVKPVGQWNRTRIVVKGTHVRLELNGKVTAEFERWTPEWERLKTTGKWKDYPQYGLAKQGRLGLQNHGNKTWFRNIRVKQ